ncbi:MAG: hypothetical protein GWO24_25585, partial [Akkermansiaceae bacterium]|nr:hypothetical protein [Akkermansiaceae bacterium]
MAEFFGVPVGTRTVRVTLHALNRDPDDATDTLFDALELRAVTGSHLTLGGSITDDGIPLDGTLLSHWEQLSGPANTPADTHLPALRLTFTEPGVYEYRLTASDGELTSADSVVITVGAGLHNNNAPVIQVGPDLQVVAGTGTTLLEGVVTDDGLPAGDLGFLWQKVSGPGPLS